MIIAKNILKFAVAAILSILCVSMFITDVLAQTTVTINPEITVDVVRYRNTGGGYSYWTGTHNIGRHNGANGINPESNEDIWRTFYGFNLSSIPANSIITRANLYLNIFFYNNGSYTASLRNTLAINNLGDLSEVWTKAASGTVMHSGITYSSLMTPRNVTTYVQSSYTAGQRFRVGVVSENEGTNLSYASTNLSLEVTYTPPVQATVRTNLPGSSTVLVDGNTYSSPANFSWVSGSSHTLQATSQPPNTFVTWFNVTTGQPIPGNPISVSPTSNTIYEARYNVEYQVTVENSFGGGFVTVDGNQYNSPAQFSWLSGSQHTLLATNQQYGNYFRWWRRWLVPAGGEVFTNPLPITVDRTGTYTADFNRQFDITVTAAQYVEPGSGGTYRVNGTNVGSTWQGAFIENVSSPITLEAVPPSGGWVLWRWSDGLGYGNPQNPRTITPTDHVNGLHAIYKLHLASSSANAIAPNTQRKIVRDGLNGSYHMVYQSAGHIWYTKSTDGGTTWSAEKRLSFESPYLTSDAHRNPSIAVRANPRHELAVTWEVFAHDPSSGLYWLLVTFMAINLESGSVIQESDIAMLESTIPFSFTARPVVGSIDGHHSNPDYDLVVWYDGTESALKAQVRNAGNGQWHDPTTLRSGEIEQFSLTPILNRSAWSLAWTEAGTLYYSPLQYTTEPTLEDIQVVEQADYDLIHRNPSIASTTEDVGVGISWEADYWEIQRRVIKYRERVSSGWSPTYVWSDIGLSRYRTPSLSAHGSSSDVTIVWLKPGSQIRYVQRNNTTWTSQITLGTGVDPQVSIGTGLPTNEVVLWRGTTSPYQINKASVSYGGGGKEESISPKQMTASVSASREGRGGRIVFPVGSIALVLLSASIDSVPIRFSALNDTLPITTWEEFLSAVTTEPFTGRGLFTAQVLYSATGEIPNRMRFRLKLRDAQTRRELQVPLSLSGTRDTIITISLPLNFARRLLQFVLEPQGLPNSVRYEVERWFLDEEEGQELFSKPQAHAQQSSTLPTEFALHQNYPNPFNPSTVIRYQLPEATHVTIKVYDVLGRQVMTMVDEAKDAGYYQVQVDASHLSSGVYLYRMTAGKYSSARKFVVMR